MRATDGRVQLLTLWSLQLWALFAQAASLKFTYPGEDMTFYYMNTIAVKYESNFSNPYLYTFCRIGSGNPIQQLINYTSPYNATALITLDFTTGSQCWFNLRPETDASSGFNSANWNYKVDAVNQTTVGFSTVSATASTTATVTSSSGSAATTTTSSTSSSTSPASTSDSQSTGLSVGAQAGIGVGVGIAGLAAVFAIVALVLRKRKRQQAEQSNTQQSPYSSAPGPSAMGPSEPGGASTYYTGSELGVSSQPSPFPDQSQKFRQPSPGITETPQMQELDGRTYVHELPGH